MLRHLQSFEHPFAYTRVGAVDPALLAVLELAWDADPHWDRYDSFYRCWIADQTAHFSAPSGLVDTVSEICGLPLAGRVRLTLQRMAPGDGATPHTDRPLLGFESARLVIQLNSDWGPEDGGRFTVLSGEERVRRHEPTLGTAVLFALRPDSLHEVEDCAAGRRTAVLHFWHQGNTEALHNYLRRVFEVADLGALPKLLDPLMDEAEASLPEERTLKMGLAALIGAHWGLPDSHLTGVYTGSAEDSTSQLAHWAAELWTDSFDVDRWFELAASVRGPLPERVAAFARLAGLEV